MDLSALVKVKKQPGEDAEAIAMFIFCLVAAGTHRQLRGRT